MLTALNNFDLLLLRFFNITLSNSFFDWLMPILTDQDNWIIPLVLLWLYLVIRGGRRGRIAAVLLLVMVGLTDVIAAQIIKPLAGRLRPSHAVPEMINLLVRRGGKYGFVSNHAANMFAAVTIIGYFYRRWRWPLYLLACTIAFSRVYVGVHYPGDVFFGGLFGYAMAWVGITLWVLIKIRELKRGRTWVWYDGNPPRIEI